MNDENLVVVGKLGSSYGVLGWLKVFSFTEEKNAIFNYSPWFIKQAGQWKELKIESHRPHNKEIIAKIEGIYDRDEAALLTNAEIYVSSSQFKPLDNGEYYWKDLVGCKVVTTSGYDLGIVTELLETGSNDVLVVKANVNDAFNQKERLIPFLDGDCIKQVDLNQKMIQADWDPAF